LAAAAALSAAGAVVVPVVAAGAAGAAGVVVVVVVVAVVPLAAGVAAVSSAFLQAPSMAVDSSRAIISAEVRVVFFMVNPPKKVVETWFRTLRAAWPAMRRLANRCPAI
jgi:hypothetical protein